MAISLICWALSLYGCQSDMLGFGGRVAVSLICWALSLYGCQSDMLARKAEGKVIEYKSLLYN